MKGIIGHLADAESYSLSSSINLCGVKKVYPALIRYSHQLLRHLENTHTHTHIKIEIEGSTYIYMSHHSKCIVILLPFIFTQNFSDFIIREASVVQYNVCVCVCTAQEKN